jgi:putative transposase
VPRPQRLLLPGGIYHVTARGIRGSAIYRTAIDAQSFLEFLLCASLRSRWRCHMYCLMPNHYHLLIETPEPNLADGMHWLNTRHARTFNLRHGHAGHLFERRYRASLIESDRHLLESIRYIALNPVRARLCTGPNEWRWSSYTAVVRGHDPRGIVEPGRVLRLLGQRPQIARRAFIRFVADGAGA